MLVQRLQNPTMWSFIKIAFRKLQSLKGKVFRNLKSRH